MSRVVHCKRDSFDVYIGRPGPWGNPFKLHPGRSREEVLGKYRDWLLAPGQTRLRARARRELRGKVLGCWCAPQLCHGDILAQVAQSEDDEALRAELTDAAAHCEEQP